MEIQIAVSKINMKEALESGDTLEVIERPSGGLSVILVDGRGSGKKPKKVSSTIVHKVLHLIGDGTRDGVAATTVSDQLYKEHMGDITAFLSILSVDLQTFTITITSNNPVPVFVSQKQHVDCITGEATAIGTRLNVTPAITQLPLEVGITVVMYTDGVAKAGEAMGISLDMCTLLKSMTEDQEPAAQAVADTLLAEAVRLDQTQPQDDMSVVVLRILSDQNDRVRRMVVSIPVSETEEY